MALKSYKDKLFALGINGFGRIGKLSVWHHVARKYFDEIVVNLGREVGASLTDIAHYVERDSTYGALHGYLYGHKAQPVIDAINETDGSMRFDGVKVRFLRNSRNPTAIDWHAQNVRLVVDTTGQFLDPLAAADAPKGSMRGHLASGAEKVIASAPFQLKNGVEMPDDVMATVMGVNEYDYDPLVQVVVRCRFEDFLKGYLSMLGDLTVLIARIDYQHNRLYDLSRLQIPEKVPGIPKNVLGAMETTLIRPQVTQAVIYGWYDNEMGSYVNMLGDRTVSVAETM